MSAEVSSIEVEELITHFIVTCYDKAVVTADKYVRYREGLSSAVTFLLRLEGVTS